MRLGDMAHLLQKRLTHEELLSPPYSLDPLGHQVKQGLYAVGSLAFLSVLSTSSLLAYITYGMLSRPKRSQMNVGYNQYILLIYQLLLADLQQSLGFVFSIHWLSQNKIVGPSAACFTQAWFIHIGDVASGFFVLAIALHTWISVVKGRKLPHGMFVMIILAIWCLAAFLTMLAPVVNGRYVFLRAGSWCWISAQHETSRLTLHYLWIFIDEFGTILTYGSVLWYLRRQLASSQSKGIIRSNAITKATRYMIVYPIVYIILTLPLAAGRMAAMSGHTPSDAYYLAAGSLITSCGWMDCILYALTRRVLVHNEPAAAKRISHSGLHTGSQLYSASVRGMAPGDSIESMINGGMRLGEIKAEQTVEVTFTRLDDVLLESGPGSAEGSHSNSSRASHTS